MKQKLIQRYLSQRAMVWSPLAKAIGHSDVATTLTPLEVSRQRRLAHLWCGLLTGLRYYVDSLFPEAEGESTSAKGDVSGRSRRSGRGIDTERSLKQVPSKT